MSKLKQNLQEIKLFVRLKGTAITRVYWVWALYTIYVAVIVSIHLEVWPHLALADNLVGVLGIVISLLLGFRANDSVGRYKEGRANWVSVKQTTRNLSRIIWTVIPNSKDAKDLIIKKSAINLLDGFCFALKHYLREEYSYDERDLKEKVKYIPKFATSGKVSMKKMLHKYDRALCVDFKPPTNIPMEIVYALTKYIQAVNKKYKNEINPMLMMSFTLGIGTLEGVITNLERLQRTPIPLAYKAHLTQSFWIYLLAMPFQLVNLLQWWTIPILGFASFFFEGVLALSNELEDPFGYDFNDLPLDAYCWVIRRELNLVTAATFPEPTDWMISNTNKPLLPYSEITGEELASKSIEEVRSILRSFKLQSTKNMTREEWAKESGTRQMAGSENPCLELNGMDRV